MKIVYEPHPVSPERKAKLRSEGYKIIDVRFAPEGEEPKPKAPKKRGRPKKASAPTVEE